MYLVCSANVENNYAKTQMKPYKIMNEFFCSWYYIIAKKKPE